MGKRFHSQAFLIGGFCISALLVARLVFPAPFLALGAAVADRFQVMAPRAYTDAPVRVVDIDEAALAALGQWPWSRAVVAEMTDRLTELGAAAIAYDIVFAEPDRTSPRRVLSDLADDSVAVADPDALPDNDEILAEAISAGPVVLGFALDRGGSGAEPQAKAGIATLGNDPGRALRTYSGATRNLDILEEAARGNGNFAIDAADARTVRTLPMVARLHDRLVPSLALEALRVAQNASSIVLRESTGGTATLDAVAPLTARVGAFDVPLSADGSYPLRFTGAAPSRSLSALRLFDDGDATIEAEVRGRIMLVGSSAVGLSDLRPTPLNPFEPGVAIHAAALEQILAGEPLLRPQLAPLGETVSGLVLGLAAVGLAVLAPVFVALGAALLLVAGLLSGAFVAFDSWNLLVDPSFPVLAVLVGLSPPLILRVSGAERDRMRLRHAFAHYLSPDMVRTLTAHPERLTLGGEAREMTFLFTDLEGFTAFTESASPQTLVRVLNAYLAEMCAIVMRHGGTIDKIVGDAVHAMFNAPLDQADHAERAVACALDIAGFSKAFARARAEEGLVIGTTRIGVNTGTAIVGNFGGAGRFDYTAHGDAINTAARLEAANKALGTTICVAASTVATCRRIRFRPIGTLMLKGKAEGVLAFEPTGPADAEDIGDAQWAAAYAALDRESDGVAMTALARTRPDDALAQLHARRIASGEGGTRIALG